MLITMKNIKLAFRNLLKQRLNTLIIIISLTIGLACVNLNMLFIDRELNTDSCYNDIERMYVLQSDDVFEKGNKNTYVLNGAPKYIKQNFSQVEDFCMINSSYFSSIRAGQTNFYERPILIEASANFFEFFNHNIDVDNYSDILGSKNNIVIASSMANKLFGNKRAIGENIYIRRADNEEEYTVTGVFNKHKSNTRLQFDMVIKIKPESDGRCVLKLYDKNYAETVNDLLVKHKEEIPITNYKGSLAYNLQSIKEAYYNTFRAPVFEKSRDKQDLRIAALIGLIILIVATFNYLAIVNNNMLQRSKEILVRRLNGCSAGSLVKYIMLEVVFVIFISFLLSIPVMLLVSPLYAKLMHSQIGIQSLSEPSVLIAQIVLLSVLLLASHLFVIYRVKRIVRSVSVKSVDAGNSKLKQFPTFTIFQIAATVALIICSAVVLKQISFINNKNIGVNKNVIEIALPPYLHHHLGTLKQELLKQTSIQNVAIASESPSLQHFIVLREYEENGVRLDYSVHGFRGDEDVINTLGFEIVEGQGFSKNIAYNKNKILINEALAKKFPNRHFIGGKLPGDNYSVIIGIVKNFHYNDLKSIIEPAYIGFNNKGNHLLVLPNTGMEKQARNAINMIWKTLAVDYPLNLKTIGDAHAERHEENKAFIKLINACSFISIFLAMIGLFATSYQACYERTKEIGVRKVNGARWMEILVVLNKRIVQWIIIASIIACPIAAFLMQEWLEGFAYKTDFSIWIFAFAATTTILIALLTVSYQSWLTARRNPIEALKYE